MHQHAAPHIQPGLDELDGGREMLEKILVVDIIDIDVMMVIGCKRAGCLLGWVKPEYRQHMGDIFPRHRGRVSQAENATSWC